MLGQVLAELDKNDDNDDHVFIRRTDSNKSLFYQRDDSKDDLYHWKTTKEKKRGGRNTTKTGCPLPIPSKVFTATATEQQENHPSQTTTTTSTAQLHMHDDCDSQDVVYYDEVEEDLTYDDDSCDGRNLKRPSQLGDLVRALDELEDEDHIIFCSRRNLLFESDDY